MSAPLSNRVRPDSEAAPWVIEEIKALERTLEIARSSRDEWPAPRRRGMGDENI